MTNTPYPELTTDTGDQAAAFAHWNAEVRASIDEYHAHPFGDRRLGGGPALQRRQGDGCPITVWDEHVAKPRSRHVLAGFYVSERRCSEPVDRDGLCAKHAADKVRLGGVA